MNIILFILNKFNFLYKKNFVGDWGLGIGDWGLGLGANGPNTQPPTPHPPKYYFFYLKK